MDMQSVIHASNGKIFDLEKEAIALDEKLNKYRHRKTAAWIVASISTAFLSKLVEIPYKLSRMSGKLQKQAVLKVLHFRIADIYYCHVERYGYDNRLRESKLLITRESWISQRRQLLVSIRELALKGDPLFNDPSETDLVLNSDYVVIPFDRMSERIKHEIPEQFRDLGIEFMIMEIFSMLII
jgi:hypothetical protein